MALPPVWYLQTGTWHTDPVYMDVSRHTQMDRQTDMEVNRDIDPQASVFIYVHTYVCSVAVQCIDCPQFVVEQ